MKKQERLKKYFGEIMREFFDYGTPAYYRVQMTNSKSILEEIMAYVEIVEGTQYAKQDHVKNLLEELIFVIESDIVLKSSTDFKAFFSFLKQEFISKNELNKEDFCKFLKLLKNRIRPILNTLRLTYFKKTKEYIHSLLIKPEESIENNDFTKLKKLSFILSTELLMMGYSKSYIYTKVVDYFFHEECKYYQDFDRFIECLDGKKKSYLVNLKLIVTRDSASEFYEIFKKDFVNKTDDISNEVFEEYVSDIKKFEKSSHSIYLKKLLQSFIKINSSQFLIRQKVDALDYEEATQIFVKEVYQFFDVINLEYPKVSFKIGNNALCIEESSRDIQMPMILKQIDGYTNKASIAYFEQKNKRISKILSSTRIDVSTKHKLKTLLLFYRYYCEAKTLEHKFLNLWIGWEHAFSLDLNTSNSWKNIFYFYPKVHSVLYIEQILVDMINVQFKRNYKNLNYKEKNHCEKELEEMLSSDNQNKIANLYSIIKKEGADWSRLLGQKFLDNDDLTKVKLFRIKTRILNNPKNFIKKHNKKISWELFRMYRLRNSIVHRGKSSDLNVPVEVLTANLTSLYLDLLDVIIIRLSINDRFDNLEQLFLSYETTYERMLSKENPLSGVSDPKEVKMKIINPPLLF